MKARFGMAVVTLALSAAALFVTPQAQAQAHGRQCEKLNKMESLISVLSRMPSTPENRELLREAEAIRASIVSLLRNDFLGGIRSQSPAAERHFFTSFAAELHTKEFVELVFMKCRLHPSFDISDAAMAALRDTRPSE